MTMVLKATLLALVVSCIAAASTAATTKADLIAAGMSEAGASGAAEYDDKFEVARQQWNTDPEGTQKLVDRLHMEASVYIKSMSKEDQSIYWKYVNQKNAQAAGNSNQ